MSKRFELVASPEAKINLKACKKPPGVGLYLPAVVAEFYGVMAGDLVTVTIHHIYRLQKHVKGGEKNG